jgi:DNA-binding Lrp family transcriptional regulator
MQLDTADRKLLNVIQAGFPLTPEPFSDLAQRLGTRADEVIQRIARLKASGIIRMIGPVMESRSLGFHSILVGMKVGGNNLEKAGQVIANHPGVSHGYERDHPFNLWFTLALPPASDSESELQALARSAGAELAVSLPAVKVFKIGCYFDMEGKGQTAAAAYRKSVLVGRVELSPAERRIVNALQQDLALVAAPFSAMAESAGMDPGEFLAGCRSLQQRGVIRRFSASINHRRAGFTANAMCCWRTPPEQVDAAGQMLAALKEVSHCYERAVSRHWQYNLFAMTHCRSREQCRGIVDKVSAETGLDEYVLLWSTKELKKTRVKYLV